MLILKVKNNKKVTKQIKLESGKKIILRLSTNFGTLSAYFEGKENALQSTEFFREILIESEAVKLVDEASELVMSESDLMIVADELNNYNDVKSDEFKNSIEVYLNWLDNEIMELTNSIASSIVPYLESVKKLDLSWFNIFAERIEQFRVSTLPITQNFDKIITPLLENYNAMNLKMEPIIKTLQESAIQWSKFIGDILNTHNEYLTEKEKAMLISSKYDWFITYDFLVDREFIEELISIENKPHDQSVIDSMFESFYNQDRIIDLLDELCDFPIMSEFNELVSQIREGYKLRLFYLVVPTVLLLIEGIVIKSNSYKGKVKTCEYKKMLNKIIDSQSNDFFKNIVHKKMLAQFDHGQIIDSPISRHAILHGGDLKYGTECNSIRLVLILYNIVFGIEVKRLHSKYD